MLRKTHLPPIPFGDDASERAAEALRDAVRTDEVQPHVLVSSSASYPARGWEVSYTQHASPIQGVLPPPRGPCFHIFSAQLHPPRRASSATVAEVTLLERIRVALGVPDTAEVDKKYSCERLLVCSWVTEAPN